MPPDASPAVEASLAPSQIYILFAITLTTFARWIEAKDRPPSNPDDDAAGV